MPKKVTNTITELCDGTEMETVKQEKKQSIKDGSRLCLIKETEQLKEMFDWIDHLALQNLRQRSNMVTVILMQAYQTTINAEVQKLNAREKMKPEDFKPIEKE